MTDQYLRMQQEMMNNMMWQQQYRMKPPPAETQQTYQRRVKLRLPECSEPIACRQLAGFQR
jgi:hypothetical protein